MMIVITLYEDGHIDVMHDIPESPHIVVINEKEEWTDSPNTFEATEDEMAEWIAAHRNEGYEDRNP